jgi:hypothetical protein
LPTYRVIRRKRVKSLAKRFAKLDGRAAPGLPIGLVEINQTLFKRQGSGGLNAVEASNQSHVLFGNRRLRCQLGSWAHAPQLKCVDAMANFQQTLSKLRGSCSVLRKPKQALHLRV